MTATIIYRGMVRSEDFPKNSYQLRDLADQMRGELPFTVRIDRIFDWDSVSNEFRIDSYDDMERLNLLVQRIDEMCEEDEAKMFALMTKCPKADVSELLDMTCGLSSVRAYPCCDDDELAELAFDNEWLPVFEECPYEILDYLDRDKVAAEVRCQHEGYLYGGYYVEPEDYRRPEAKIELPEPEKGFFRLQLASDSDRARSEWLTLPCGKTNLENLERQLGCPLNKMICTTVHTALPNLHPYTIQRSEISEANELAVKLSELSHNDFVKLKAVMELGDINSVYKTSRLIDHLPEFDFDPNPNDASVYGKIFLYNTLPPGFNTEIFAEADMEDFGRSILSSKGGMMTSYGAVSGRGQELYAPVYKEQEQTEDKELDEEPEVILS